MGDFQYTDGRGLISNYGEQPVTSERGRGLIRMTLLILALSLPLTTGKAQAGLGLSLVAEYPLGDACPVTGVVSPDGDAVWALMVDCINDYTASLQAFSTADGAKEWQRR